LKSPVKNKYDAVPYVVIGGFPDENAKEEIEANAHLIAAAPKMYRMLQDQSEIMKTLDEWTHPNIELDAVKADIDLLLAEARGENDA
jgi:thiamine monophosphate synthase